MSGFPTDSAAFLADLSANNERGWFHANKSRYEMSIKIPAKIFAGEMADALTDLTGHSFESKIFRINRDLRFSKDKTPYNTHVRMSWTPQIDHSAPPPFMMSLEPTELTIGVGVFALKGKALDHWRERAAGDDGAALEKKLKGLRINDPDLKRVPPLYHADHPRAHMLKRKGMNV